MPRADEDRARTRTPLKSYATILEQETAHAEQELMRPGLGLFLSGLLAGFGVGTSLLLVAVLMSGSTEDLGPTTLELLRANLYTVGFVLVVMSNTDLFTEYTTLAILPVLSGDAPLRSLARLWGIVYGANAFGAAVFALLLAHIGPALEVVEPGVLAEMAREITRHSWHVILLSGTLAGWLMGLLSWLVSAGRDTTSQVIFIWLVTGVLGFAGLHHSVVGTAEVLAGVLVPAGLGAGDFVHFLLWATLGNALGGVIFALLIRYSVVIGGTGGRQEPGLRGSTSEAS